MARRRGVGWWDGTWNPVAGCMAVSPGCKNCYAAKDAATVQTYCGIPLYLPTTDWVRGKPVFNGTLTELPPEHHGWRWPLKWRGAEHPLLGPGQPSLIFVGDMADVFHERRPETVIHQVVGAIAASRHIGLLLTKRADVMATYFSRERAPETARRWQQRMWLGFSAERQKEFDERWAHMKPLAALGWTVFVSVAPMLNHVVLPPDFLAHGRRVWVICSGEQQSDGRPMHPDWARALRDQCAEAGVPFFLLQMSGRAPIPADLFVRQFPAVHG